MVLCSQSSRKCFGGPNAFWYLQIIRKGSPFLCPAKCLLLNPQLLSLISPCSSLWVTKGVQSQRFLFVDTQHCYYRMNNKTKHGDWVWNSRVEIGKFNPLSQSHLSNLRCFHHQLSRTSIYLVCNHLCLTCIINGCWTCMDGFPLGLNPWCSAILRRQVILLAVMCPHQYYALSWWCLDHSVAVYCSAVSGVQSWERVCSFSRITSS